MRDHNSRQWSATDLDGSGTSDDHGAVERSSDRASDGGVGAAVGELYGFISAKIYGKDKKRSSRESTK